MGVHYVPVGYILVFQGLKLNTDGGVAYIDIIQVVLG